jgi:hypothetical protein
MILAVEVESVAFSSITFLVKEIQGIFVQSCMLLFLTTKQQHHFLIPIQA